MTPNYLNPPSPLPFVEANQSQDQLLCTPTSQTSSSSSDIFFSQTHDQKPLLHEHDQADAPFSTAGTSDHHCLVSPPLPIVKDSNEYSIKPSMYKRDDRGQCDSGPIRWMSSKMRLMRRMMNSDGMVANKLISSAHTSQNELRSPLFDGDNNNNSNNSCSSYGNSSNLLIRVCADCNTTKTPLWRSGPQGPKSLCNACGIRQRKARRAMAAAAAGNGGVMVADMSSVTSKVRKEKRSDCTAQHRKRCKLVGPRTKKKLRFDDFRISLSKNSAFHQVFPQDEKEAAILLMALSCGLVNG